MVQQCRVQVTVMVVLIDCSGVAVVQDRGEGALRRVEGDSVMQQCKVQFTIIVIKWMVESVGQ